MASLDKGGREEKGEADGFVVEEEDEKVLGDGEKVEGLKEDASSSSSSSSSDEVSDEDEDIEDLSEKTSGVSRASPFGVGDAIVDVDVDVDIDVAIGLFVDVDVDFDVDVAERRLKLNTSHPSTLMVCNDGCADMSPRRLPP